MIRSIVFAGVSAAGLALAVNILLVRAGPRGIAFIGPVFEEGLKTGAAFMFNASVPGTHILFGILEALGDCAWGRGRIFPAALCGVAAHAVFGLATHFILDAGFPVYTAVLAAITVHVTWNTAVLKIVRRPRA